MKSFMQKKNFEFNYIEMKLSLKTTNDSKDKSIMLCIFTVNFNWAWPKWRNPGLNAKLAT